MGTLNWTVLPYSRDENRNVPGTRDHASNNHTTSTSAAAITGLVPQKGQVVRMQASEDMWVRFGGRTVAVGTGLHIASGQTADFEVSELDDNLAVQAIDVS